MNKYEKMTQDELCEEFAKIYRGLGKVLSLKMMMKINELREIEHQQMHRTYNFTLKDIYNG